jgi:two-component system, cell cycle sensor histidine kinase and response regulator CckA
VIGDSVAFEPESISPMKLRVLIVEDSEDDMLLMLRELRRSDYELEYTRVDTAIAMRAALDRQTWDVVIADYTLPTFSAPDALQLLQDHQQDLPFIIVSGTIGEETAVAAMKAGANDYLIKGNLVRLLPAIERELREAAERRKRQLAEHALQTSEALLRQLAEASPVGIFRADARGHCIYVNARWCQITGLSFAQSLDVGWIDALHADDREFVLTEWQRLIAPRSRLPVTATPMESSSALPQSIQKFESIEFRFQHQNGPIIWVLGQAVAERDEAGEIMGYIGNITDITEKKQLTAQLLRAQRMESLGTLASGMAHDFNNILTPILAAAQLLPLKLPDLADRDRHLLQLIEDSAKRGADLVRQMMAFARGVEGKRLPLQAGHLLAEIVQVVEQTFPKTIDIQTHIATPEIWLVSADATQLHQVLMNLCINARDSMPEGGTLRLSVENTILDETYSRINLDAKPGAYVMITVKDTGTGIESALLERIYDPFFTTKDVGKGTGLGLSMVLGIINNHDGFITVQSQVGQGTQFSIYLPAIEANTDQPIAELLPLIGQGELILVVDDEVLIQQVIKTALEYNNYRVLLAADGAIAIDLYTQHQQEISVVLMDMMMPSVDGFTAIRAMQTLNPQIKVIASSGLVANHQLSEVTGTAVKAFLPKPYVVQQLLTTLRSVLVAD